MRELYGLLDRQLPKDAEYHSGKIVPHRILHDASVGTIVGLMIPDIPNAVLIRIGTGAVMAFVTEFFIQPKIWKLIKRNG